MRCGATLAPDLFARAPRRGIRAATFAPGEAYQFECSHEHVLLAGAAVTLKVAQTGLCYSRMPFARPYPRETHEQRKETPKQVINFCHVQQTIGPPQWVPTRNARRSSTTAMDESLDRCRRRGRKGGEELESGGGTDRRLQRPLFRGEDEIVRLKAASGVVPNPAEL